MLEEKGEEGERGRRENKETVEVGREERGGVGSEEKKGERVRGIEQGSRGKGKEKRREGEEGGRNIYIHMKGMR